MKSLLASFVLAASVCFALLTPARAAGTSFTFTNGPTFCGVSPACYVTSTSLGGWYYLYAVHPTAMTGGTVYSAGLSFHSMSTSVGVVDSLSSPFTAAWTQTAGTPQLSPSNTYHLSGAFSGTDTAGRAYTGVINLDYSIYYSSGGGGRGGGGAGWHFKMLDGSTTITYS